MIDSFYKTVRALESIDQFQGSNEELLKVRERLLEPSKIRQSAGDCLVIEAMLPMEYPAYFANDCSAKHSTIRTARFKCSELRWNGVSFKVWLSLTDGKIYM